MQQGEIKVYPLFKIQYGQIYSSNYDVKYEGQDNLKSNMDRFIENAAVNAANKNSHLKSNMDRFIVSAS